jgi:hypothetical protein
MQPPSFKKSATAKVMPYERQINLVKQNDRRSQEEIRLGLEATYIDDRLSNRTEPHGKRI